MTELAETRDLPVSYPSAPGWKADGPSREAARQETGRAETLRRRVLEAFEAFGAATADECAEELGESVLAVRPRLSELRAAGKLEDTGQRRRNASGKLATVWRLAAARLAQPDLFGGGGR